MARQDNPCRALSLSRAFTEEGKASIVRAQDRLTDYSEETAQRFTIALNEALTALCLRVAEQIAARSPMHPDEAASLAYSRPAYLQVFTTQKKRVRRSSTGTYRLYYDLLDADKDG